MPLCAVIPVKYKLLFEYSNNPAVGDTFKRSLEKIKLDIKKLPTLNQKE